MFWLALLAILILGCYLIVKSQTRGYKILGYFLVGSTVVFAVMAISLIGVETDSEIEEGSGDNFSMIVN
ncbi:hypothetical protein [Oceanobacillus jeddahense]|uniref:Uncharacterized protein n=1 Tax=Oceanobacillus jeddahense TaxID=1462527 RepID=A0ABY5JP93_9BACI|nr:hypothetical protein [Oceanobacillus jeddahense]UUI02121.1 hypothetical protein NP439_19060 [Oceanobacillus jeddahense]